MDVLRLVAALHNGRGHAQILKTTVGARTDEHGVDGDVLDRHARLEAHVVDGAAGGIAFGFVGDGFGVGHGCGDRGTLAGVGAPGHVRFEILGLDGDFFIEHGVIIGLQGLPVFDGLIPHVAFRRMRTPLEVFEGDLVRSDHAGTGACFDGHVADGHTRVHGELLQRLATVFDHIALAAASADLGDDGQNDVLGGHALRQLAFNVDGHGLERLEAQGLRGHHMFDLGGADAEGQCAERAMGGGVRVAAHDGHARLGEAQHRGEGVHDALVGVAQRVQAHAEFLAVLLERGQLQRAGLVGVRLIDVDGRGVVVLGGNELVNVARLASGQSQAFERLRARDFVHKHQVDVQQIGCAVGALAYQMIGPDLFGQCRSHGNPPEFSH